MKTIFELSHGGTHLAVERDDDGNTTFTMEMSGEWYQPSLELVPTEVSALIEALENDG
jgi:hypothetical protein